MKTDLESVRALEAQHVLATYRRAPVVFVRGEGSYLFDGEGRRYLDFISGIGVVVLGHAHRGLAQAIADQAATLIQTSNLYFHPLQGQVAARLDPRPAVGAVATALFALYPGSFEAITWISSVNSAGLVFALAAWLAFLRGTTSLPGPLSARAERGSAAILRSDEVPGPVRWCGPARTRRGSPRSMTPSARSSPASRPRRRTRPTRRLSHPQRTMPSR